MLQGPAAALWRETRDALVADGHRVLHVSLALGDRLFWRRPGRIDYHGRLEDWPAWLAALVAREGVSDILYFRDCLPYHRAAAALAETRGLRAWAIENGYLRPDWLTMEPFGMGRHSRFTRRAETIRALAAKAPAVDMAPRFRVPFPTEARCEMAFNLAHALGKPVYRGWTDDRPVPAWREYLGWVPYLARRRRARREAEAVEARCRCAVAPYTLVALQMETDYQVRVSSAFGGQAEMLELVMLSFARRAAAGHRLVIKIHPFDNGLIDWRGVAAGLATRFGVEGRVDVIRGGRLDVLLARAHGLVTINSTTAVHALR
ncbi:MAG: capsular biosynthesis protein, partial [Pseudomonadota bacterium]